MKSRLFLFFIAIASFKAAAQTMNFKGKSYPATASWDFICENYALTGTANIQIAKTEKGGVLKLSIETTNPTFTLSGMTYVFLTDNTIISCSDKMIREVSASKIISYYFFSPIEMAKLKTTEIQSIHFNIKGNDKGFNSQVGNFTAVNRKSYFSTNFDKSKKTFPTATAISLLYK